MTNSLEKRVARLYDCIPVMFLISTIHEKPTGIIVIETGHWIETGQRVLHTFETLIYYRKCQLKTEFAKFPLGYHFGLEVVGNWINILYYLKGNILLNILFVCSI